MALITCQEASFGYEGHPAIEGLNFAVKQGMYLCVVGQNGSGKSTLIKGMLHLLQPLSGTLTYDDGLAATQIGYLPQQTAAQKDFPASVYEVVLSGFAGRTGGWPFYSRAQKAAVLQNLALLGVLDLKSSCYRELSGGQQQRVLLARALCASGRLLLLDEPVAGLDPLATQGLYGVIRDINQRTGMAVVMVSHDMHSALQNASHVLHLDSRQTFFGPVDAYRQTDICKQFTGGGADV